MSGADRRSWPSRPVVRRRQTLPSLPSTTADGDGPPTQTSEERLDRRGDSWTRRPRSNATATCTATAAELALSDTVSTSSARGRRLQVRHSGDGQSAAVHVGRSISGSGYTDIRVPVPHRRLGRTPSSPSVLLSKVKERIREKVFETSAEWPHLAAIERERRQRAAMAFEQSLRARNLASSVRQGGPRSSGTPGTRTPGRLHASDEVLSADPPGGASSRPERVSADEAKQQRRDRIRSDPARRSAPTDPRDVATDVTVVGESEQAFDKAAARLAFRRRSISEDTYNRSSSHLHSPINEDDAATMTAGTRRVGVVCSNEDLKAIFHQHKRRLSPAVSPTTESAIGLGVPSLGGPRNAEDSRGIIDAADREPELDPKVPNRGVLLSSASVEVLTSGTSSSAAVPVAGFTPTVARITEQDSLELLDSVNSDTDVLGTHLTNLKLSSATTTPSTVPDVVYDEHGQTWDVYGAEFDPMILGQAIQSYLEKIMARKAVLARDGATGSSERLSGETTPGSTEDLGRRMQSDGGRGSAPRPRQRDGALGFVMRYLCSSVWRQSHAETTVGGDKI